VKVWHDTIAKYRAPHTWVKIPAGIGTFSWYVAIGEGIGATPDGRRSQSPVGPNFSPASGADREGPLAVINSFASTDLTLLAAGSPLDLQLPASPFSGEVGLQRLMSILKSFGDLKGNIMTITCADAETLRAAQREPEKYRSLRIRMGGWSAYFVTLSKEQQDYHIARVEGRMV
jgi:formate C-acetyltransferase